MPRGTDAVCSRLIGSIREVKTCSACGHVLDSLDLDVRAWECPGCGTHHDRDLNAAKSVLAEGLRRSTEEHAVAACGGPVRANLHGNQGSHEPVNQEPGSVTIRGNPPDLSVAIC